MRRADTGLLLPRMAAVGDLDLNERLGSALEIMGGGPDLPPAIDTLTRQMMLAKMIAPRFSRTERRKDPLSEAEALRLAGDLARVIDQMQVEQIPLSQLSTVDRGDLSAHWDSAFDLFRVLAHEWPEMLSRRGQMDPAERRNAMLAYVAETWRANPPTRPVIAAGIATTAPAIARLLRVVAGLPKGMVVFPHLDLTMEDAEWDMLGPHAPDPVSGHRARNLETHPQFHLKLLLERMGVAREEVRRWTRSGESDAPAIRSKVISRAFAPAENTALWAALPSEQRNLSAVRVMEAQDGHEEAMGIAIAIREALETAEERVQLVTANRALAGRVAAQLRRWGVEADDSAGQPLDKTPPGSFVLLLLEAAASRFAPVELLQLLKHPLCAPVIAAKGDTEDGLWRVMWLERVRELDLALRGPRPDAGLAGIEAAIVMWMTRHETDLRLIWVEVAALLDPLTRLDGLGFAGQVEAIANAATAMTGGGLWRKQAGQELAAAWGAIAALDDAAPVTVPTADWPAWAGQILTQYSVRPAWGGHPRVAIYGLLEARMQQADLVICAGLNEGSWPQLPAPDPWLAPALRRRLGDGTTGLPALERNIGLSAHDLASLMGGKRLLLTRAKRDEGSPALASRFLLRLQALAGKRGLAEETRLLTLARQIDRPATVTPVTQPAPTPPAHRRRVKLAVTALDRLRADPYAFYAKSILNLSPLELVDARPTAAWRGTMVHDVLEQWAKHDHLDPDRLTERARAMLSAISAHPLTRILWEPRLLQAIDWVKAEMQNCIADGRRPVVLEGRGQADILGVVVHGKADRIDRDREGRLIIIDYKTGQPPSNKAMAEGYALQLGLLGLIAAEGGFDAINPDQQAKVSGVAGGFEYWSLAKEPKSREFGFVTRPTEVKSNPLTLGSMIPTARGHLEDAINAWILGDAPFTAKLHPDYAPYTDYDHLMRKDEWYGREGDGA